MLSVGSTRTHYCDNDERETVQRLEHLSKNGIGKVIATRWRCTVCDEYVGDPPPPAPPALEELWGAS